MSFYFQELWVAFITQKFVEQCCAQAIENCLGCKNNKKSVLLHSHEWCSLLEKIENHFETARSFAITHLEEYYLILTEELPHTNDLEKDKLCYINIARYFLLTCTPFAVYYGRYVNESNDEKLYHDSRI